MPALVCTKSTVLQWLLPGLLPTPPLVYLVLKLSHEWAFHGVGDKSVVLPGFHHGCQNQSVSHFCRQLALHFSNYLILSFGKQLSRCNTSFEESCQDQWAWVCYCRMGGFVSDSSNWDHLWIVSSCQHENSPYFFVVGAWNGPYLMIGSVARPVHISITTNGASRISWICEKISESLLYFVFVVFLFED